MVHLVWTIVLPRHPLKEGVVEIYTWTYATAIDWVTCRSSLVDGLMYSQATTSAYTNGRVVLLWERHAMPTWPGIAAEGYRVLNLRGASSSRWPV